MDDIKLLRNEIDKVDNAILDLLVKRMDFVERIGGIKTKSNGNLSS